MRRYQAPWVLWQLTMVGLLLATILSPTLAAEPTGGQPTVGQIERLDPRLEALVPAGAQIEVLAMGFDWSEGPVWTGDGAGGLPADSLLFSDVPQNHIHRWHAKDGLSIFMQPSGFTGPAAYSRERGSNGLLLDQQGRLLCCEHGDRRVVALVSSRFDKIVVRNTRYLGFRLETCC